MGVSTAIWAAKCVNCGHIQWVQSTDRDDCEETWYSACSRCKSSGSHQLWDFGCARRHWQYEQFWDGKELRHKGGLSAKSQWVSNEKIEGHGRNECAIPETLVAVLEAQGSVAIFGGVYPRCQGQVRRCLRVFS